MLAATTGVTTGVIYAGARLGVSGVVVLEPWTAWPHLNILLPLSLFQLLQRQQIFGVDSVVFIAVRVSAVTDNNTHKLATTSILTAVFQKNPGLLVAWHNGRTSVFGRQTFLVLRSTCSQWVTICVVKPSAIAQPTRPTQPFILSRLVNE